MAHENALKTKVDIMRGFTKGCLILKSLTPPSSAHITNAQLNYMRRAICRITQPYRHARERGSRDVTDEFDSVGEFILVEYREDDPRDNGFIAINAKPMAGDEVALNDPSESRGDADGTATINSTGRSTVLAVPPPPTACAKSHGDLAPRSCSICRTFEFRTPERRTLECRPLECRSFGCGPLYCRSVERRRPKRRLLESKPVILGPFKYSQSSRSFPRGRSRSGSHHRV
jgi:hypothetical protein